MMKLSTKSRYGLRILIQIALDNLNGKRLSQGKKISKKQGITEAYLEQIMIPLKRGGVVGTVRGCNGGYQLKKATSEITVLEVIELFEGQITLSDCNSGKKPCVRSANCPTIHIWKDLEEAFRDKARSFTLEYIIEQYKNEAKPDYII
jgi:Rrf2 family cysteine metabolism transcriptional repressor